MINKLYLIATGAVIAITIAVFLVLESEPSPDHTRSFEYSIGLSDNFNGTYFEQWCLDHNGVWIKSENDCGFETKTDEQLASIAFKELLNPQISQEKTQAICEFLEMECPSHARFTGSFDVMSGETFVNYEYKNTS